MLKATISITAAATLAACSPSAQTPNEGLDTATIEPTPTGQPAPDKFASTAWRFRTADGARFTTFIDPDGLYRDVRNGDAWQEGNWTYSDADDAGALCFLPDDENGIERCWEPGRMTGDTMKVSGANGKEIELERVEYAPVAETTDEEE